MNAKKSGILTTEFWVTLIVTVGALVKLFLPEKEDEVQTLVEQLIEVLPPLLILIVPLVYIRARTSLKIASLNDPITHWAVYAPDVQFTESTELEGEDENE